MANLGNELIFVEMSEMNLKNALRNFLGIRTVRKLPPAGPLPPLGSNIVRGKVRIRLKYPVSNEQWKWFTDHGWRTIDMRTDRRRYVCLADKYLVKLLGADRGERDAVHQRLLESVGDQDVTNRRPAGESSSEVLFPLSD